MPNEASRVITVRFDEHVIGQLEERARLSGRSMGLEVRAIVQAELANQFSTDILQRLSDIDHQSRGLRADLARTLEVILVNLAGVDPDEVRNQVTAHLGR
jgi:plasmid stability protein